MGLTAADMNPRACITVSAVTELREECCRTEVNNPVSMSCPSILIACNSHTISRKTGLGGMQPFVEWSLRSLDNPLWVPPLPAHKMECWFTGGRHRKGKKETCDITHPKVVTTPHQIVYLANATVHKISLRQNGATGALIFSGYCHNTSTHCQL